MQHTTYHAASTYESSCHATRGTGHMQHATCHGRCAYHLWERNHAWHVARSIAARTARRGPRGGRAGTVGSKGRWGVRHEARGRSVSASVSRRGSRRRGGAKHQAWDDVRSVVVALSAQYCPSSRLGPQALMAVELSCGATPQPPIPCTRCS
jgi:hypothetical protein